MKLLTDKAVERKMDSIRNLEEAKAQDRKIIEAAHWMSKNRGALLFAEDLEHIAMFFKKYDDAMGHLGCEDQISEKLTNGSEVLRVQNPSYTAKSVEITEPEECCIKCRFFRGSRADGFGQCHKVAPRVTSGIHIFPTIKIFDWCGDFEFWQKAPPPPAPMKAAVVTQALGDKE